MPRDSIQITIGTTYSSGGAKAAKSAVKELESDVKASHKRVEASAKSTDRAILASQKASNDAQVRDAKRTANEFIRELKRVERERKEAEASVKKSGLFGSVLKGSFLGSAAANLATSTFSSITSGAQQAGRAVLDFASQVEQANAAFTTLTGSSGAAEKLTKQLLTLSRTSSLDFGSIAKMSQRLQGAGIEAGKTVELIKDIGNVAAATGEMTAERMEGIGVAISQIVSKGKVQAEELEQLAERGIPAWKILSEQMGVSSEHVRKLSKDGKITADQLVSAFQRVARTDFAGAMERQAKTAQGAWKQIENYILQSSYTMFKPAIAAVAKFGSDMSQSLREQEKKVGPAGVSLGFSIGEAIGKGIREWRRSPDGQDIAELFTNPTLFFSKQLAGVVVGAERGLYPKQGLPQVFDYTRPGSPGWRDPRKKLGSGGTDEDSDDVKLSKVSTLLNMMRGGVMAQESGGNPLARNRRTDASGLFQVMPANIAPWTKAALGQALSQQDFINSPKAQEAVFNHVMGQYIETALKLSGGNEDVAIRMAAAAWYGGPKAMGRYNDPRQFRSNEPSFAEYTSQVLTRSKKAKLGGLADIGDVQDEIIGTLRQQSDAKTEAYRNELIDRFLAGFSKSGLIPTREMLDRIVDRLGDFAAMRGDRRPEKSEVENEIFNAWSVRLAGRVPSIAAEPTTLGTVADLTRQPLETMPENPLVKDSREAMYEVWRRWDERRREAFEEARDSWNDLLTDMANGDFKSVWRKFKDAMLQQFIQPVSQQLAQLFGNPFGGFGGGFGTPAMAGTGGFGVPSFGGFGGFGGTPGFNPNAGGFNFAGSQAMGGGGFGGIGSIFGGLFGRGGGGGSMPMSHEAGHLGGGFGKGGIMGKLGGMSGIAGLIGAGMTMAGGAIGGKWGNTLSLAGTGAMLGLQFGGPWGALIGGAIGAGAGLISMLFGRDDSGKKLKEAARNLYGIHIKDKGVLNTLKKLGKSMFGNRVAENAEAVVSSDEGQLILRNYAEATNQSNAKMDRFYIGDETWSGNQFRTRFGGFKALGGSVTVGKSYIVGERGPETFTPSQNGHITPNGGGMMSDEMFKRMLVVMGTLEETVNEWNAKLRAIPKGHMIEMAAQENPEAFGRAIRTENSTGLLAGEKFQRSVGAYG